MGGFFYLQLLTVIRGKFVFVGRKIRKSAGYYRYVWVFKSSEATPGFRCFF